MSCIIVVGGGPAGCFAAIAAAERGNQVTLLEQNEKIGKKLYITGKGRCNVTNASDMDTVISNVMTNRKFLFSAFRACDNKKVMDFFEGEKIPLKVERGNRVFPCSDHSSDIIKGLTTALKKAGVSVCLNTKVTGVLTGTCPENIAESEKGSEKQKNAERIKACVRGVTIAGGRQLTADAVILATGGYSYQSTGSTGDGYRFGRETGHRLISPVPSLVPLVTRENWPREVTGLSLKNTAIEIYDGKKKLYSDFGEMLFTHFGVSGPMILSASAAIRADHFDHDLKLFIDLKPALDRETLDKRILRDFEQEPNRQFKNALEHLVPGKLAAVIRDLSCIDPEKKINEITREERQVIVNLLKKLPLTITGKRDWNEAIITKGGISVRDVNPSTMESKVISNLYFCGELLDLDAMTGGYNLQIAWSTGFLAGKSSGEQSVIMCQTP